MVVYEENLLCSFSCLSFFLRILCDCVETVFYPCSFRWQWILWHEPPGGERDPPDCTQIARLLFFLDPSWRIEEEVFFFHSILMYNVLRVHANAKGTCLRKNLFQWVGDRMTSQVLPSCSRVFVHSSLWCMYTPICGECTLQGDGFHLMAQSLR